MQSLCAARDTAAKLCSIVVLAVQPSHAEGFMTDLIAGFADHAVKKHKFELQDGYLAATGYVLAQSMTGRVALLSFCYLHTFLRPMVPILYLPVFVLLHTSCRNHQQFFHVMNVTICHGTCELLHREQDARCILLNACVNSVASSPV